MVLGPGSVRGMTLREGRKQRLRVDGVRGFKQGPGHVGRTEVGPDVPAVGEVAET